MKFSKLTHARQRARRITVVWPVFSWSQNIRITHGAERRQLIEMLDRPRRRPLWVWWLEAGLVWLFLWLLIWSWWGTFPR